MMDEEDDDGDDNDNDDDDHHHHDHDYDHGGNDLLRDHCAKCKKRSVDYSTIKKRLVTM